MEAKDLVCPCGQGQGRWGLYRRLQLKRFITIQETNTLTKSHHQNQKFTPILLHPTKARPLQNSSPKHLHPPIFNRPEFAPPPHQISTSPMTLLGSVKAHMKTLRVSARGGRREGGQEMERGSREGGQPPATTLPAGRGRFQRD